MCSPLPLVMTSLTMFFIKLNYIKLNILQIILSIMLLFYSYPIINFYCIYIFLFLLSYVGETFFYTLPSFHQTDNIIFVSLYVVNILLWFKHFMLVFQTGPQGWLYLEDCQFSQHVTFLSHNNSSLFLSFLHYLILKNFCFINQNQ